MGPTEVEHAIAKHKSVSMVAVIGIPDELRGEIIKVSSPPFPSLLHATIKHTFINQVTNRLINRHL